MLGVAPYQGRGEAGQPGDGMNIREELPHGQYGHHVALHIEVTTQVGHGYLQLVQRGESLRGLSAC